ncbi:DUF456 domain-containing protein [Oceanithermus sp.]|jgi:uncharacterized protein YqgC (DUF456 family)
MNLLADWAFVFLWLLALVLTFVPVVPATLIVWGAALLHEALVGFSELGVADWVWLIGLGLLAMTLDNVAAAYGARRFGAGRAGIWGAVIGALLGALTLGPVGVLIGPFLGALAAELLAGKNGGEALRAAWGSLLGVLGGVLVKFAIHVAMGWMVLERIF